MSTTVTLEMPGSHLHVLDRGLPPGVEPVLGGGLLSRVGRACGEHGCLCPCVGRSSGSGCLLYWCGEGGHYFMARSRA